MSARDVRTDHQAHGWLGWAAQAILLLLTLYVLVFDLCRLPINWQLQDRGIWGGQLDGSKPDGGFVTVRSIRPGQALDRAGVVVGDRVRFTPPYDAVRYPQPGDTATVTVEHARQRRQVDLHVMAGLRSRGPGGAPSAAYPAPFGINISWWSYLQEATAPIEILIGGFIIWRSRGRPTLLMLGASLVSYAPLGATPPQQFPAVLFPYLEALDMLSLGASAGLLYGFALSFYRDRVGPLGRITKMVFWAYVAAQGAVEAHNIYRVLIDGWNPGYYNIFGPISFAACAACMGYLILGWRRSAAETRQRYTLLLIATGSVILDQTLQLAYSGLPKTSTAGAVLRVLDTPLPLVACVLYPYTILRQKVFDLGFAVNRSLVYGAVSAILLVGFGLVEWASDHFIPIEGREKNAVIDAGVALVIFLTFHRVRDAVEHGVERLLFRSWHEREAALRRFVAEAAYVLKPEALGSAFVQAINAFAEGAPVVVYLRGERGAANLYRRLGCSGGPGSETIDVDDPAVVRLRHEPAVIEPGARSRLSWAELALPMAHRNELIGFVSLGPKPSGLDYRPDEKALLGWAAHQVGLDLHTLRVEQLEDENRSLQHEVATAQAQCAAFREALSGRPPELSTA